MADHVSSPAVSQLIASYRDAWGHPWESLTYALRNVSEDEARFQAPSYMKEARDPKRPLPGTILWHIVHIARCKAVYAKRIEVKPKEDVPDPPEVVLETLQDAMTYLQSCHEGVLLALGSLCDKDLEIRIMGDLPLGEFVRAIVRHDVWHAAQIVAIRRAYAQRSKQSNVERRN